MKRFHKILAGTVGALSLVAMTAVVAAPYGHGPGAGCGDGPGWGGMGMGWGGGGMPGGGYRGMHGDGPGMMSEAGLAEMKTRLEIIAQQETAWKAFADKAAAQAALMEATHARHHQAFDADQTAPDRMAQHLATMGSHLAGMQALNGAMKDLYGVLTPEQRSQADQYFGRPGWRGAGHRHMHG